MRRALAHLAGIATFTAIGVPVGILYILIVGRVLDRGGDGFGLTAAVFAFPMYAAMFAAIVWIPVQLIHERRRGRMTPARAAVLGCIGGVLFSAVVAGPRGWTLAGGSTLFNWFYVALAVVGSIAHNALVQRLTGT